MFDVNEFNATAALANLIQNVQPSNSTLSDSSLYSSFNESGLATPGSENNSSMLLLSDIVANTTAVVVDYATQWLSATMSTLINSNTETTASISSILSPSDNDGIVNYTRTAPALDTSYLNSTNPSAFTNATTSISTTSHSGIYSHTPTPTTNRSGSGNGSGSSSANGTTSISTTSLSSAATYVSNEDLITENSKSTGDSNDDYNDCDPENPNFNCSRMDYVVFILGPQTLPLYQALMVTIVYGGIFITGLLGNILVCIVIVKHSAMHTATNYYLFSLAVSDLIYLIFGLPAEVFLYWHQYPYLFGLAFCKVRAYISEASTYVSVLTIVAFSVERYLAICHPLHLYAMSGFKRALRIIALLWVVSYFGAIPFGLWTSLRAWNYPPDQTRLPESELCGFYPPDNLPIFEVSSLVFFFIPMLLIFYFYGRMGVKIRSRTTQKLGVQQGSMHRESRHQHSRKAVIRMLAAVVLTFFICWLPFHIQRLWYVHGKESKYFFEINEWLFSMTGLAYYFTCTINPILYNVMSRRYRVAFKDILCGRRKNAYYNNGFARDQSSFRETTIASSLYNSGSYDRVHSVRVRSIRIVKNAKDRSSVNSNNILWKKADYNGAMEKDIPEDPSTKINGTNAVVVCVDNGVNGRTKVFTKNDAHETLLNKNHETCI